MGLLGVALGAGERLVTQLRGRSTKRFNKTLRPESPPPSVWPSHPQLLSPVPTWAPGSPSAPGLAAPWSCCPRRPFSVLLLSSQPPTPHTRPFPRILREPEVVRERQAPAVPSLCPGVASSSAAPRPRRVLSLQAGARLPGPRGAGRPPGAGSQRPARRLQRGRVWRAEPTASRVGQGADAPSCLLSAGRPGSWLRLAHGGRASPSPRRKRSCWNGRAGWMGAASRRAGATSTGSCAA